MEAIRIYVITKPATVMTFSAFRHTSVGPSLLRIVSNFICNSNVGCKLKLSLYPYSERGT